MKISMFQVDAFTDKLFAGSPAAVCTLDYWLPEEQMQQIAAENNIAETAFIVAEDPGFSIRWFTPALETDICGHATLAAAHVIFTHMGYAGNEIIFSSLRSGSLTVKRTNDILTLDFPADSYVRVPTPQLLIRSLGIEPMETFKGKTHYMAVLPCENDVIALRPDFRMLNTLETSGVIVTAAGDDGTNDFVSRFFAPRSGINEDHANGGTHTTLTPYWAKELGKNSLIAMQLSGRSGHLQCEYKGDRVLISGSAVTYMEGALMLR
jgi:PhzF family phenazine biosynthesis protein